MTSMLHVFDDAAERMYCVRTLITSYQTTRSLVCWLLLASVMHALLFAPAALAPSWPGLAFLAWIGFLAGCELGYGRRIDKLQVERMVLSAYLTRTLTVLLNDKSEDDHA
jgi:hypothetical protein